MAALHEALKSLAPCDYTDTPLDNLASFLTTTFSSAQTIVESVPIPSPTSALSSGTRSRATSTASNSSEISASAARSSPPPSDIEALQKEWKYVKLGVKENPLEMSVYKMSGKDGKGSWFARRSVHEGLGFKRWKAALQREFPKTMEVQGGPGEGNIRGIGGEVRVAEEVVDGVGKMEVYLLSAQFPGPTAPRDFVTMLLTSDSALEGKNGEEVPRHFMVVSKPCKHPDAAPRDGYIRGQYESVEFIREIPSKGPRKSSSTTQLDKGHTRNRSSTLGKDAVVRSAAQKHPDDVKAVNSRSSTDHGRSRGKTISFDHSRGSDAKGEDMDVPKEESEGNPVEWIMITRSDPGGSVPRFMIDRGTPGGIVNDAGKFLDWACGKDLDDYEDDDSSPNDGEKKPERSHRHDSDLHSYQTNGHLSGLTEEKPESDSAVASTEQSTSISQAATQDNNTSNSGLLGMVTGGIGAAGGFIASHTPEVITSHLPTLPTSSTDQDSANTNLTRQASASSISTVSSTAASFTSALETRDTNTPSTASPLSPPGTEKELAKLDSRKKKLDEKLEKTRKRENSRASEDSTKQDEAIAKAAEKHDREVKKQEEKYKKEVLKLQAKKEKEERKAEEKRRKAAEKDERAKLAAQIEDLKRQNEVLTREKEGLKMQVGELQKENTLLAARVGRLGGKGEEILREVKDEVGKAGRSRSTSLSSNLRGPRPSRLERKVTDLAAAGEVKVNGSS